MAGMLRINHFISIRDTDLTKNPICTEKQQRTCFAHYTTVCSRNYSVHDTNECGYSTATGILPRLTFRLSKNQACTKRAIYFKVIDMRVFSIPIMSVQNIFACIQFYKGLYIGTIITLTNNLSIIIS